MLSWISLVAVIAVASAQFCPYPNNCVDDDGKPCCNCPLGDPANCFCCPQSYICCGNDICCPPQMECCASGAGCCNPGECCDNLAGDVQVCCPQADCTLTGACRGEAYSPYNLPAYQPKFGKK